MKKPVLKKFTLQMDPELHRRLKVHAAENGRDMTEIIHCLIRRYFKQMEDTRVSLRCDYVFHFHRCSRPAGHDGEHALDFNSAPSLQDLDSNWVHK